MKSEVSGFLGPLYDEAAAVGFFESAAFAFEVADQGSLVLAQGGALLKSELPYPGGEGVGLWAVRSDGLATGDPSRASGFQAFDVSAGVVAVAALGVAASGWEEAPLLALP